MVTGVVQGVFAPSHDCWRLLWVDESGANMNHHVEGVPRHKRPPHLGYSTGVRFSLGPNLLVEAPPGSRHPPGRRTPRHRRRGNLGDDNVEAASDQRKAGGKGKPGRVLKGAPCDRVRQVSGYDW